MENKICFGWSCGVCKNFTNCNSGIAGGSYGFCVKHREYVHSSLLCKDYEINHNARNTITKGLEFFKEETEKMASNIK